MRARKASSGLKVAAQNGDDPLIGNLIAFIVSQPLSIAIRPLTGPSTDDVIE
jgi:hypothetical protein